MASSGSRTRPACADQEDMPKTWMEARLEKEKEKDVPTPPCWCGDVCKLKVSTDRKKSWTEVASSTLQVLHLDRSRGTKRCPRGPTSRLLTEAAPIRGVLCMGIGA
ncbi:hypothetical protein CFC21_016835 [Triticum aestivum]|uniref:Uncharacterized protein n=2 Tax=Triticum aestivum TaxID=4565 RepID=A0A9R1DZJ7_WHEAT|nr:hypothetical protein CFC21_016834 [Triticum aestivum]KAF7001100.1 hypothetical protein CFC21_016835 [Triticum aestivum]